MKNLLLIGPPGVGKTTIVKRLVSDFSDIALRGFFTREICREDKRIGFEAVGMSGPAVVLAHVSYATELRVGPYGVVSSAFEGLLREEFSRSGDRADLYIIDEIGKMECSSKMFPSCVKRALDSEVPVIGTISEKGKGFIAEVKGRDDIEFIEVTKENRMTLPDELLARLKSDFSAAK